MIAVVHNWLSALVATAGVPAERIYTDAAALSGNDPVPKAVLLVADESLRRVGTRVGAQDADGGRTRVVRWQLWERRLPVLLHLELASQAVAEAAVDKVLAAAFLGPDDNGNRWKVACRGIAWPEEKSRLVANRVRVQLTLEFVAGVYRDRPVPLFSNVQVAPASSGA